MNKQRLQELAGMQLNESNEQWVKSAIATIEDIVDMYDDQSNDIVQDIVDNLKDLLASYK